MAPIETDYEWTATGSGNWNTATNWTPAGLPGTAAGRQSVSSAMPIPDDPTIFNNSVRNLNALEFDSANRYFVAATGSLDFQEDASGPTTIAPSITVASGAHQIQLAVNLVDSTSINVAPGASLDLNNQIDLNGNTLTTSGTVRINHSTVGGGTVNSTGALAANGESDYWRRSGEHRLAAHRRRRSGRRLVQGSRRRLALGILDVVWDVASLPVGTFTVVTAGGSCMLAVFRSPATMRDRSRLARMETISPLLSSGPPSPNRRLSG